MNLETHPDTLEDCDGDLKLRVWHIANPPQAPFHVDVSTPEEGLKMIRALSRYDLHLDQVLYKHAIQANASGLEFYNPTSEEWEEWHNSYDEDIIEAERWASAQAQAASG